MNYVSASTDVLTPTRADLSDSPRDILNFAVSAFEKGSVALATLVEIRGGAARPLGSHVAIAADGRYAGYVSGGCVEAAVAAEALQAMAIGRDRFVKFGEGSPFLDITLPCGGGITVAVHILRQIEPLRQVIEALETRQSACLNYNPRRETLDFRQNPSRSCWTNGSFLTVYHPRTRLIVSGKSVEAHALSQLAETANYEVSFAQKPYRCTAYSEVDPFTAIALLHHDLEDEIEFLRVALECNAFYLGALGSTRTHLRRVERLHSLGIPTEKIDKIKAPIGIFGPARDSNTLAVSILADVSAARLAAGR